VAGAAGIVGDLLHHRTRHRVLMQRRRWTRASRTSPGDIRPLRRDCVVDA
jgi:hypothetical protein